MKDHLSLLVLIAVGVTVSNCSGESKGESISSVEQSSFMQGLKENAEVEAESEAYNPAPTDGMSSERAASMSKEEVEAFVLSKNERNKSAWTIHECPGGLTLLVNTDLVSSGIPSQHNPGGFYSTTMLWSSKDINGVEIYSYSASLKDLRCVHTTPYADYLYSVRVNPQEFRTRDKAWVSKRGTLDSTGVCFEVPQMPGFVCSGFTPVF